jgi:V/A-type H+-transporting ATPase subunit D
MTNANEIVPTQSMLLELRGEQAFLREGHEFLDQKRILLAGEILRRLARYEALSKDLDAARAELRADLARALALHGLAELGSLRAGSLGDDAVEATRDAFLGVPLVELRLRSEVPPPDESFEARALATSATAVLRLLVELAGVKTSLENLLDDYRRTERRTRALEDVILPELGVTISSIEEHLDEQEREEAVRARSK